MVVHAGAPFGHFGPRRTPDNRSFAAAQSVPPTCPSRRMQLVRVYQCHIIAIVCGWAHFEREAERMAKNQSGTAGNGKIAPTRVRLSANGAGGANGAIAAKRDSSFVRSSHSLSTRLAKQLRALAYEQQTSESSIIECALWLFFKNGSADNVLRLMTRAEIAPRRRRRKRRRAVRAGHIT